jgi:hypothetical protein
MITKKIVLFALYFITNTVLAQNYISVTESWIRTAPPNAPMLGGFMDINNSSDKEIKLTKVNAKEFKRVELHRTIDVNGTMKMMKQDYIPIPANGLTKLEPGSWHIMFIGPVSVPKEGDMVMLGLSFDDGSKLMVHTTVKKSKLIKHNHDSMEMNHD